VREGLRPRLKGPGPQADNPGMRALLLLGLAVACAGCVPKSGAPDAVQAWQPIPIDTDAEFSAVCFVDTLHGWMVGGAYNIEGGLVARTADGGATWTYTSDIVPKGWGESRMSLNAVVFLTPQRGLVATHGGLILKTDDGGDNWRVVRHGRSPADHLTGFSFIDEYSGWCVGGGGVLYTTDGGEHWFSKLRSNSDNGYLGGNAIHFRDAGHGVMVGQGGAVWLTLDGGERWEQAITPWKDGEHPNLYDLFFVDEDHGWAVGEEGALIATTDGGLSWFKQDCGVADAKSKPKLEHIRTAKGYVDFDAGDRTPGLMLSSVFFTDAHHGWITAFYANMGRSLMLRTSDGGTTWAIDAQVAGEELRAVFMLSSDRGWAVGDRVREGQQVLLRRVPKPASS
jgi:photosystem II stability/assembly factor-like uncharacterized protein